MKRIAMLVAALAAAAAVRGAEPIGCAFGVCLGQVVEERAGELRHVTRNIWRILPKEHNPSFPEYYVLLVPSSKVVAEISAWTAELSVEECTSWLQAPLEALEEKYGQFEKKSDISFALHADGSARVILLNCVGAFGDWHGNLRYRDTALWEQAKAEQKQINTRERKRGL